MTRLCSQLMVEGHLPQPLLQWSTLGKHDPRSRMALVSRSDSYKWPSPSQLVPYGGLGLDWSEWSHAPNTTGHPTFHCHHWGQGGLKPVITCWEHWELWLNEPRDFMVITYRTHLKCTYNICSIWDWWEHFWNIWTVTSTCTSYVTTHNSWQSFEICLTMFSKYSYYMPSRNIWNLFKMLLSFWHIIVMFFKTSHVIKMFPLGIL